MTRTRVTREFYIPTAARKVSFKAAPTVTVYAYERKGVPMAVCFIGKASKPSWHYSFRSEADRTKRISDQVAAVAAHEDMKAKRRANASKPHGWEVGMVLSGSWGYDQTNVNFFEVVRVVGKCFVEVEQIGSQTATDAGNCAYMTDKVVPDLEHRTGKITKHRVSNGYIKSPVHGIASPWSGTAKYSSSYH